MKIINTSKGFTLIELLVVMIIFGAVGTIAVNIFAGALRGGNKAKTINMVRQEGNFAINQMSKMIAYSETFEGVSTDGTSFSADCPYAATPISYKFIRTKQFDGGTVTFICDAANHTVASGGATLTGNSLLDTTTVKLSTDSDCNFYCQRTIDSVSPTINIVFKLSAISGGGNFVENNATIVFETSVKPRNN